jgi:flagellar biosynthesis protein FliR
MLYSGFSSAAAVFALLFAGCRADAFIHAMPPVQPRQPRRHRKYWSVARSPAVIPGVASQASAADYAHDNHTVFANALDARDRAKPLFMF